MKTIYQLGTIIQEKYRVTKTLGKGGVAITYQAIDLTTESLVAIKVISLKQLDNWKQVELFKREAEVLAKLNHPAIPQYIDYFDIETDTDKAFHIVQQQAPGKSLSQLVESGWRTNEAEVKQIARQVLEILTYLHSLDPPVIHRDIKPNNLIRDEDGKIYLVDFGAVQNTYYNTLMQGSTVVGTYGYMSPEQFQGKALPATDLYSLGATLLYLLTQRSPAELPQDTLKLDFRNSVNISESFADWLDKILEPNIEDRFSNADLALYELSKSKKKKQRKLITNVAAIALILSLVSGINSYKWFILSRLGYVAPNICQNETVIKNYIKQGGKANIIASKHLQRRRPILNCIILSYNIKSPDKERLLITLIEKGADVNQKDEKGNTSLLISAERKEEINIVKILLEHGADTNAVNDRGESPLLITNDNDIAKLLITNGANVNAQDERSRTPLYNAVRNGDIKRTRLLLENNADVNAKNSRGYTVLNTATSKRNIPIVKLLIEYDADIHSNPSSLFSAASSGNIELFKLLLNNGVDAKSVNTQGNTILFSAASGNSLEIVKLSIEKGANPRLKNKYEESPLAFAKTKEIAELLIKNGADINAQKKVKRINSFSSTFPSNSRFKGKIKYGSTPLSNAVSQENIELVKLLLEKGAEPNNTSLFNAVYGKNLAIVKLLLEYGADVHTKNSNGRNVLFYANSKEIAQTLIDRGLDVNTKYTKDNTTPIFTLWNLEVIQLLINNGADVNAKDKNGQHCSF